MGGIPITPLVLGLLGLIPFFATAISAHLAAADDGYLPIAALAFLAYAATILSFLAGARWGMELSRAPAAPNRLRLILSMIPPIYAWLTPGLFWAGALHANWFTPGAMAALLVLPAFMLQWLWDEAAGKAGLTPAWYPALRRLLSVGVLIACFIVGTAGRFS